MASPEQGAQGTDMGTISKSLELLNYFSVATPEIGLSEFRVLTGKDKATVYRYLCELEESGFVEQDRGHKKYRIGSARGLLFYIIFFLLL